MTWSRNHSPRLRAQRSPDGSARHTSWPRPRHSRACLTTQGSKQHRDDEIDAGIPCREIALRTVSSVDVGAVAGTVDVPIDAATPFAALCATFDRLLKIGTLSLIFVASRANIFRLRTCSKSSETFAEAPACRRRQHHGAARGHRQGNAIIVGR